MPSATGIGVAAGVAVGSGVADASGSGWPWVLATQSAGLPVAPGPAGDGLTEADALADGLTLALGDAAPDGDGSGSCAGSRSIGSVRMRRKPPGSSVTTTSS